MQKERKNKHMTIEDRQEIQECLCKGMTFKTIARRIGKDPTTVSKEVKLHAYTHESGHTRWCLHKICDKIEASQSGGDENGSVLS